MQEIGIALKPTRSGAIVFNVAELSLDEAAQAAQDFQVNPAQCSPPQDTRQDYILGSEQGCICALLLRGATSPCIYCLANIPGTCRQPCRVAMLERSWTTSGSWRVWAWRYALSMLLVTVQA